MYYSDVIHVCVTKLAKPDKMENMTLMVFKIKSEHNIQKKMKFDLMQGPTFHVDPEEISSLIMLPIKSRAKFIKIKHSHKFLTIASLPILQPISSKLPLLKIKVSALALVISLL